MLQRIQTVFLALIAIGMMSMLALPIWTSVDPSSGSKITLMALGKIVTNANGQQSMESNYLIGILCLIVAGVSTLSIFSYKNRWRQLQLGMLNSILIAAILGTIVYFTRSKESLFTAVEGSFGIGLLIPSLSLIFNTLANRFIRKDEEFVRSADRMR